MKTSKTRKKHIDLSKLSEQDFRVYSFVKMMEVINKDISAFTTLSQENRNAVKPDLFKLGVTLLDMQLLLENVMPIGNMLREGSNKVYEDTQQVVYADRLCKCILFHKKTGMFFVYKNHIPNIIEYVKREYGIQDTYKSFSLNSLIK